MRTAMRKHCNRYHKGRRGFLEKGEEPSKPKYLHWQELITKPATASLTRMHRYYKKPLDLNLGQLQPKQLNSDDSS